MTQWAPTQTGECLGGFSLCVCVTLKSILVPCFYPSVSLGKIVHPAFFRSGFGRSIRYSTRVFSATETGGSKFIITLQSWFFCLQEHKVWTHERDEFRLLMLNRWGNWFSFSCNGDCKPAWTMLNMCNQGRCSIYSLNFSNRRWSQEIFISSQQSWWNVFVLFH